MKLMAVADRFGLPLGVHTCSASPHEVKLARETVCERFTDERPEKMIGDKAYDSDPLDAELAKLDIELIAPIKPTAKRRKRRTAENFAVTNAGGKLNASLRGWVTFVGLWFATNIIRTIT